MPVNSPANSSETDRVLSEAALGDRSALGSLLTGFDPYLRRLVELRLDPALRGRLDPADVVQETHLAVSRELGKFARNPCVSFKVWLRQVCLDQMARLRRTHLKTLKRTAAREVRLSDVTSLALAQSLLAGRPSRVASRRELIDQVRQVLAELSENDREVLLLRHFEELTNVEISELLSIEPASVSQRYGRAVRRFCRKLEDRGLSAPP